MAKAIPARIPAKCLCCGQDIEVGQMIAKRRVTVGGRAFDKWSHQECPTTRRPSSQTSKAQPKAAGPMPEPTLTTVGPHERAVEQVTQVAQVVRTVAKAAEQTTAQAGQLPPILAKNLEGLRAALGAPEGAVTEDQLVEGLTLLATTLREEIASSKPQVTEVHLPGQAEPHTVEGTTHPCFETVAQLAQARLNVLLVGPAGCGKTHLCGQIGEALGLPFGFDSCSTGKSEGQLLGRLLPTGEGGQFEYQRSEFVRCYEEGGVFLLDEIDAADPNTLLVLNSALANGELSLPNRPEAPVAKRHPDFVLVAAANTFGRGADRQYVGREQLDAATLDRFAMGQVELDYDQDLEAQLCPCQELRDQMTELRTKAAEARLRRVVSTRAMKDGFKLIQLGWTVEQVVEHFLRGWSQDERAKVGR